MDVNDNVSGSDSDDDDDEAEWQEEELEEESVHCLFCSERFTKAESLFLHCKATHDFDINLVKLKWSMDQYSYIKMVNYLRKQKGPFEDLIHSMQHDSDTLKLPCFDADNEDLLLPVLDGDQLLCFDVESIGNDVNADDVNVGSGEVRMLQTRVRELEEELGEAREKLEAMRTSTLSNLSQLPNPPAGPSGDSHVLQRDDSYFESYSELGIHEEMLDDEIRMRCFHDAVTLNSSSLELDQCIVLDIGCGTGILSMFACNVGAANVIAVDQSDIMYQAMDIIQENKMSDRVKCIKGKIEEVVLPVSKVDVIISEWMGYFLYFESMMDSVLWARDHYLNKGGTVLPDRHHLYISAIDDDGLWSDKVGKWATSLDEARATGHKFPMTCMKTWSLSSPYIHHVRQDKVCAEPACVQSLDMNTADGRKVLPFESDFTLTAKRKCEVTALIGYFTSSFQHKCSHTITLDTSPSSPSTHWKQTVFFLSDPLPVEEGEDLKCSVKCERKRENQRSLNIQFLVRGRKYCYSME